MSDIGRIKEILGEESDGLRQKLSLVTKLALTTLIP